MSGWFKGMIHKHKTCELIKYLDKLQSIIEEEYTGTTEWKTNHEEYKSKYEEIKKRLEELEQRELYDREEKKKWKRIRRRADIFSNREKE